jgi:hypothetical protein
VQVVLPERLTFGPICCCPGGTGAAGRGAGANPNRLTTESRDMRLVSIVLIGVIGAANAVSLDCSSIRC